MSCGSAPKLSDNLRGKQVPHIGHLTREEIDAMEEESFAFARQDMHAHRVIDLAVNSRLDVKWIREAMGRVERELDPGYRGQLEEKIASVQEFIDRSGEDAASVDADAFHEAKENLDRESVRLHEIAIAASLREEGKAKKG